MRYGSLLYQHTLYGFSTIVFSFTLYVSKYHVQRDNSLPGGVLCDIPLDFVIRVPNRLNVFLILPIGQTIEIYVHDFVASLNNSSVEYYLCCGIFRP